jgi:hypothetical protein
VKVETLLEPLVPVVDSLSEPPRVVVATAEVMAVPSEVIVLKMVDTVAEPPLVLAVSLS